MSGDTSEHFDVGQCLNKSFLFLQTLSAGLCRGAAGVATRRRRGVAEAVCGMQSLREADQREEEQKRLATV